MKTRDMLTDLMEQAQRATKVAQMQKEELAYLSEKPDLADAFELIRDELFKAAAAGQTYFRYRTEEELVKFTNSSGLRFLREEHGLIGAPTAVTWVKF